MFNPEILANTEKYLEIKNLKINMFPTFHLVFLSCACIHSQIYIYLYIILSIYAILFGLSVLCVFMAECAYAFI